MDTLTQTRSRLVKALRVNTILPGKLPPLGVFLFIFFVVVSPAYLEFKEEAAKGEATEKRGE